MSCFWVTLHAPLDQRQATDGRSAGRRGRSGETRRDGACSRDHTGQSVQMQAKLLDRLTPSISHCDLPSASFAQPGTSGSRLPLNVPPGTDGLPSSSPAPFPTRPPPAPSSSPGSPSTTTVPASEHVRPRLYALCALLCPGRLALHPMQDRYVPVPHLGACQVAFILSSHHIVLVLLLRFLLLS